jgi:hypothetical protein
MVSSCGDGCSAAQPAGLLVVLIGNEKKNLRPSRHKEKMRAVAARWRSIADIKIKQVLAQQAWSASVLKLLIWCLAKIFHLIRSICPLSDAVQARGSAA